MLILSIANLSAVHIGNSYFGDNQLMKVVDRIMSLPFSREHNDILVLGRGNFSEYFYVIWLIYIVKHIWSHGMVNSQMIDVRI